MRMIVSCGTSTSSAPRSKFAASVSRPAARAIGLLAQRRSRDAKVLERDLIETLAALSAHDFGALLRQRIVGNRQRFLAHAALPRKATSTFSGTAPSEVNSVSMA